MNLNDASMLRKDIENFIEIKNSDESETERKIGQRVCLVKMVNKSDEERVSENKRKLKSGNNRYIHNCLTKQ